MWAGLGAVGEVGLAVIGVYALTVLLVFPLLPVIRTLAFELDAVGTTTQHPDDVVRAVEAENVADAVRITGGDSPRLVLAGVRDAEQAASAVSRVLEQAGYGAATAEETSVAPDREDILRLGAQLPAMLAIQSAVFLTVGWILSVWRVGRQDPARVSRAVAVVVGVAGGAATLVSSALVGLALDRIGLPVQEQVWVQDLLGQPDTLARVVPWMVLIGPLAEEVFFRGYAFRLLSARAGGATGYLVSSLLFAVVHLNPSGMPIYVLIGLAFCWLYRRTRSLWAPVAAHVTLNGLVLSFTVASAP